MCRCARAIEEEAAAFAVELSTADLFAIDCAVRTNRGRLVELGSLLTAAKNEAEGINFLYGDIQLCAVRLECIANELMKRLERVEALVKEVAA